MKNATRLNGIKIAAGLVASCMLGVGAGAATLTSPDFSIGYGFTGGTAATGSWNTSETASANTPITQGNFIFSPTVLGQENSGSGPTFPNRVLADGSSSAGSGYSGVTVLAPTGFQIVLNGSYAGTLPVGATNVQTSINLTQLSIYGDTFNGSTTGNTLGFTETTTGNMQAQTPAIIPIGTANGTKGVDAAANYVNLVWTPTSFNSPGTAQTRTFGLSPNSGNVALDGLEIEGNVTVSYDVVPEPASAALLLLGAPLLAIRRRRAV